MPGGRHYRGFLIAEGPPSSHAQSAGGISERTLECGAEVGAVAVTHALGRGAVWLAPQPPRCVANHWPDCRRICGYPWALLHHGSTCAYRRCCGRICARAHGLRDPGHCCPCPAERRCRTRWPVVSAVGRNDCGQDAMKALVKRGGADADFAPARMGVAGAIVKAIQNSEHYERTRHRP